MSTSILLLLQQQLSQLVQMNELLLCERDAFTNREAEKIEAINQQKLEALDSLNTTDQQIATLYKDQNPSDVETGEVKEIKVEIDKILTEVKQQNEVNGRIIQHSQVNLNMLKDILVSNIGGKKDRAPGTYNQTGYKSSMLKGRPIKA
jgi:flagellar biosynthesis/type III secretory pathway chaperone